MVDGSRLINGAVDIRAEGSLFYFALGEWLRSDTKEAEFVVAQRCVIPTEEARGLLTFLLSNLPPDKAVPVKSDIDDSASTSAPKLAGVGEKVSRQRLFRSIKENDVKAHGI